jgi:hypothetical protein
MNRITKIWENVERREGYYELRSCYPDPGVIRYLNPLKTPQTLAVERSEQSILYENMQWIRIDMEIRLLKQRLNAGQNLE